MPDIVSETPAESTSRMTTSSNADFLSTNNPLSDAASTSGGGDHPAARVTEVPTLQQNQLPSSAPAAGDKKRGSGSGEPRTSTSGAEKPSRPSQSGSQGAEQGTWGDWLGLDHLPDLGVANGLQRAMSMAWKPFEVVGHAIPNGLSLFELNAQDRTSELRVFVHACMHAC